MNRRDAILEAAKAAESYHRVLGSEESLSKTPGTVDVFGSVLKTGAALMFRPLDGLLGACLTEPMPGVIVTTRRSLAIQRFTCAHELGHLVLKHRSSLDGKEILTGVDLNDTAEIQANHFATGFLTPRWLFAIHARAQGWNKESLRSAETVYQLSLRVGASYRATLVALKAQKLLTESEYGAMADIEPRALKQKLLGRYVPKDFHGNVWLLTDRDRNRSIEGQPNDLFVVRLNEKSGAGYIWSVEDVPPEQFRVVSDDRAVPEDGMIGGQSERILTIQSETDETAYLSLRMRRPWEPEPLEVYSLHCDLQGREKGLPRSIRQNLASAA